MGRLGDRLVGGMVGFGGVVGLGGVVGGVCEWDSSLFLRTFISLSNFSFAFKDCLASLGRSTASSGTVYPIFTTPPGSISHVKTLMPWSLTLASSFFSRIPRCICSIDFLPMTVVGVLFG